MQNIQKESTVLRSIQEESASGWELFCLEHGLQTDGQLVEDHILEGSYGHLVVGRAVVLSANAFGMEHLMESWSWWAAHLGGGRSSWRRIRCSSKPCACLVLESGS